MAKSKRPYRLHSLVTIITYIDGSIKILPKSLHKALTRALIRDPKIKSFTEAKVTSLIY